MTCKTIPQDLEPITTIGVEWQYRPNSSAGTREVRLKFRDPQARSAHFLTPSAFRFGRPGVRFDHYNPEQRAVFYSVVPFEHGETARIYNASYSHEATVNDLEDGRVLGIWHNVCKIDPSLKELIPEAHKQELVPVYQVGGEQFAFQLPESWFVEEEPQLPVLTTDVRSGRLRLPKELVARITEEVGLDVQIPIQYQLVEQEGSLFAVVSPRVWKGQCPHTAFTTGRPARPTVHELLDDGDYEYRLGYSHCGAWMMELEIEL